MARIRRNVLNLPPGDKTVSWYEKAVAAMQARPITDPTSWRYQAAVHEYVRAADPLKKKGEKLPSSSEQNKYWTQCQHGSWFFLPWHRMYLHHFEQMVLAEVKKLGGPATWALPYWNYSASATAALLPAAFRHAKLPGGTKNHLFVKQRDPDANAGLAFAQTLDTDISYCLQRTHFPGGAAGGSAGFGGPVTAFQHSGGTIGSTENVPHGSMHGAVAGAAGWMGSFATAALDPIFWLHHCNIDRLWEVWRNQGPQFRNPTSAQWLSTVAFDMHDGTGNPFTFVSRDMLDTTRVLHGYRYDMVPVAREPGAPSPLEGVTVAEGRNPELVGANQGPVPLEGNVTRTTVTLQPQAIERRSLESTTSPRVYLNLENITGTGIPGDFNVFIDMPGDREPPAFAGVMTTFGLERATDPAGRHGGSGLNQVFEITEVARKLGLTQGTVSQLQVTFVREGLPPAEEAVPAGLEDFVKKTPPEPNIKVGRVSLYYE